MMFKRFLSLVLVLCCLAGCLPLPAGAEEPPDLPISGTCGDNLTWTLDEGGTLTISGTGKMDDYSLSDGMDSPWVKLHEQIKEVCISEGVTNVSPNAFTSCNQLSSATVSSTVEELPGSAFFRCPSLTTVAVSESNLNFCVEENVLLSKQKDRLILYPAGLPATSYDIPETVTSIGDYAFAVCEHLTFLTIPNGVTSIGNRTFMECGIQSLTLPNSLTEIQEGAFINSKIQEITIPNGVEVIEAGTFEHCHQLEKVELPDSIKRIEKLAFSNCTNLLSIILPPQLESIQLGAFSFCEHLQSVTIPASVTYIADAIFSHGLSLREILVEDGNVNYTSLDGVLLTKDRSKLVQYPVGKNQNSYSIPEGVSIIGANAFYGGENLTEVELSNGVTVISYTAFGECSNLHSLMLPSSLKTIKSHAFLGCRSLQDVYCLFAEEYWNKIDVDDIDGDELKNANFHFLSAPTTYSVTLNPTGGTVSPTTLTVANGATYGTLPTPARGGYTFDGWYTAEAGGEKITADTTVNLSEDQTLFAHWKQNGFTLRGTITGHKSVTYKEIRAWLKNLDGESFDAVVQPEITDSQTGKTTYAYEVAAPLGQYNFMIETKNFDDYISVITKRVDFKKDGQVFDVNLPSGKTKTEVKKNGDQVPNTLVGGLDELITQDEMDGNQEVEVTLTAGAVAESDPGAVKIKEATPNQILSFLDLSIQKKVNSTISPITDTGSLKIEIVVPFQKGKKNNVKVYRFHNGNVDVLTETRSPSGEFIVVGENSISIYASKFSVYAIGYSDGSSSGPSQGGGYPSISYYSVNLEKTEHGTVTAKPTSIYSGGTVTLTVKPEDGYKLDTLTVADSQDKVVEVTEKSGKYTFKMPSSHVMVKARFVPVQTTSPTPVPTPKPTQEPTPTPVPTPEPWKNPFPDVKNTAWYKEAVEYVCVNGLMTGYTNGKFGPNDQITRAQFAQLFYNKEGRPSARGSEFTDVKPGRWYTDAVNWAAKKGVVNGVGGGKFAPEDPITREQMATMLWRYEGSPKPEKSSLRFKDGDKVSKYAREAMCWATENGIINGKSGGLLDPLGTAERCEVAQMLMNYLK